MFKTVYAKFGRAAHRAATPFFKLSMSQKHVRVRVLIVSDQKEILLVKSWLGHQKWSLPGGGIRHHEAPSEAAAREVHEETGLRLVADQLKELGTFANHDSNAPFTIACFIIEVVRREPRIKRRHKLEMLDVNWFPLAELPKDHSPTVDVALDLYKK
jgi:ADP-ribose pyrophosphatase YjhB (NUDIX family)